MLSCLGAASRSKRRIRREKGLFDPVRGAIRRFGARIARGIGAAADYSWPELTGTFEVDAWQVPVDQAFREAVECEVALRARLFQAFWPVELKSIQPKHFLRFDRSMNEASVRASEIVEWLIVNKRVDPMPQEMQLLELFETLEAIRATGHC